MHGKARDEASGLHARILGAVALLAGVVPSLLSVAFVCGDERDAFVPAAYFPADVRGGALPGGLPGS